MARVARTARAEGVAAEKVLEDVKGVGAEAAAGASHALLERVLAILIVNLALFGVRKHLVRRRYLFELRARRGGAGATGCQRSRAQEGCRSARLRARARAFSGSPPLSGCRRIAARR